MKINGRMIEIGDAFPLSIGDWKKLEKQHVSIQDIALQKVSAVSKLVFLVLQKVDKKVTMEEIDALPMHSHVIKAVTKGIRDASKEDPDTPFSPPSSDSGESSDGGSAT